VGRHQKKESMNYGGLRIRSFEYVVDWVVLTIALVVTADIAVLVAGIIASLVVSLLYWPFMHASARQASAALVGPGDPDPARAGVTGGPLARPAATSWPTPSALRPTPPCAAAPCRPFHFRGDGASVFGIYIVNVLLVLATLGFYTPWARVRTRRYFVGQTEFEGDRFAYHGTGAELFLGYLKAFLVLGLPLMALNVIPLFAGTGELLASLLVYAVTAVFIPLAIVSGRRYRLSRTSWRGIRFSLRASSMDFVKLYLGGALLSVLTLGSYYPAWIARRQAFLVSNMYFGNRRFGFAGDGRPLRRPFWRAVLLLLPTAGLSWLWFSAARHRYFAEQMTFGAARLHSTMTGGALLGLTLSNLVLVVGTIGLALPWAWVRTARFTMGCLTVEGDLDLDAIVQEAQHASPTGEGLASFFDADFDLG
jgi:uncharacterized membrane protein YjgN (DUF898 family)